MDSAVGMMMRARGIAPHRDSAVFASVAHTSKRKPFGLSDLTPHRYRNKRSLFLVCLEPLDEPVGGAVVVQFGVGLGKFRKNLLRELLTEFNTPLVVAVDVPDNALCEDLVFVHGDEGAERFRRNIVHHDGVGRVGLRPPP